MKMKQNHILFFTIVALLSKYLIQNLKKKERTLSV